MHFPGILKQQCEQILFRSRGSKPWTRGYEHYKRRAVERAIDFRLFRTDALPAGYGFRLDERVIEYPWLFSRLPNARGRLLDAGSSLNHHYLVVREPLKSKDLFISTLAPETDCFWQRGISYVFEDFRESCFRDGHFDWIVSISTLEHIGLDNSMLYTIDRSKNESNELSYLSAVAEYRRMLKPGGRLFLSFPFGAHKNHGWFQVFDASMVDSVFEEFRPATFHESHFRYLPDGWVVSSRDSSEGSTFFDIHADGDYAWDLAAASRAVVCIELEKPC